VPENDGKRADRRLERALETVARALDELGVPWAVIGGIAVIARGVRRMTTDIDAVIQGDATTCAEVLRALADHEVRPRIDDAEAFAATNLVLLVRHEPTGVDVDLSFGWTELEHRAIASSTETAFGRVRARIARPQELVVLKAVAGRPVDIQDVTALLLMHPEIDVAEARRSVAELATIAEAPELIAGFNAALEATRTSSSADERPAEPRTPPKRRPKRRR
jgi:hypothetical protein